MRQRLAFDYETSGSDFSHGCRPFYLSTTVIETGVVKSWGDTWRVDPFTRNVSIPKKEIIEVSEYLSGFDLVASNAPFEIECSLAIGVDLDLDNIDCTQGMLHTFDSLSPKGLKRNALTLAGIKDDDQKRIHRAGTQARAYGKKQGWDLARPQHPHFPHLKRQPSDGWVVLDMWMCREAWLRDPEIREKHPEWEYLCWDYGDRDTYRTGVIDVFCRQQLHKRGLWEQYVQNQKRLLKRVYEMKKRGATLIPSQINKIRKSYSYEAKKRVILYRELWKEDPKEGHHTNGEIQHTLHNKIGLPVLMWTDGGKGENKSLLKQRPSTKAGSDGILPTYKSLIEKSWSAGLRSSGLILPEGYSLDDYYDTQSDIPKREHDKIKEQIKQVPLGSRFQILSEEEYQEVLKECRRRELDPHASSSEKPEGSYIPLRISNHISRANLQKAWLYLRYLVGAKKYNKAVEYLDSYAKHADPQYRVHFNYILSLTRTLRWSSKDPNAQNIGNPTETTEEGNPLEMWGVHTDLRSVFGPRKGRIWICGDYNQLQLRLFAKWSGERSLVESFERGYDAHTNIACKIYGIPLEESKERITKAMRRIGKNVNFGFIFGASPAKIELTAGRPGLWDHVIQAFPNAHKMMSETKALVEKEGRVWTAGGYPLVVRETHKGVNYIIQGDEGELVREAVEQSSAYLDYENSRGVFTNDKDGGYLCLQVHDELVFDLPATTPVSVIKRLKGILEDAGKKFGFVTPVDFKRVRHGFSWSEAEKIGELAA